MSLFCTICSHIYIFVTSWRYFTHRPEASPRTFRARVRIKLYLCTHNSTNIARGSDICCALISFGSPIGEIGPDLFGLISIWIKIAASVRFWKATICTVICMKGSGHMAKVLVPCRSSAKDGRPKKGRHAASGAEKGGDGGSAAVRQELEGKSVVCAAREHWTVCSHLTASLWCANFLVCRICICIRIHEMHRIASSHRIAVFSFHYIASITFNLHFTSCVAFGEMQSFCVSTFIAFVCCAGLILFQYIHHLRMLHCFYFVSVHL